MLGWTTISASHQADRL